MLSHGFICPKGPALKALHDDPDRLRTPMRRTPAGTFEPVGWDEAFELIDERLAAILSRDGRDAVAVYLGNPSAHNLDALIYGRPLLRALGSRNVYSASTVDQMPKQRRRRAHVRDRDQRARPRRRSHRPPADARAPTRWRPTARC